MAADMAATMPSFEYDPERPKLRATANILTVRAYRNAIRGYEKKYPSNASPADNLFWRYADDGRPRLQQLPVLGIFAPQQPFAQPLFLTVIDDACGSVDEDVGQLAPTLGKVVDHKGHPWVLQNVADPLEHTALDALWL